MSLRARGGESLDWFAANAEQLDAGTAPAASVLPRLVACKAAAAGVPSQWGGEGGDVVDGIQAIAEVAQQSLAASFMLWGHRTYIEYLLKSTNGALRERQLPELLAGRVAGATGLSNAMKFLAGLEPLQITAQREADGFALDGKMHWVTNLRPAGFHVAAAVDRSDGGPALIMALSSDDDGLERSADLDLMAMRSTDTAAIAIKDVRLGEDRILAERAVEWLPRVRPAFVGLQCGMSIGLARRALAECRTAGGAGRGVLAQPIAEAEQRLERAQTQLFSGLRTRVFERDAPALFQLRIDLAELVAEAVSLELQASGGRAYLAAPGKDFARRWREAAFIPVITPSLVQLRTALNERRQAA